MKRIIAFLLVISSFILVFGSFNVVKAATYGDFEVSLNSYSGVSGYIITDYFGPSGYVVIPETINGRPVQMIGTNAFCNKGITGVYIPDTVKRIGNNAFAQNRSMESIYIPASVEKIDASAFWFCNSLEDIYCGAKSRPSGYQSLTFCSATFHWGCNRDGKTEEDLKQELANAIASFKRVRGMHATKLENGPQFSTSYYENVVWNNFESAMAFDTTDKTVDEINAALDEIENSYSELQNYEVNMWQYMQACKKAEKLSADNYTEESWSDLQELLVQDIDSINSDELWSLMSLIHDAIDALDRIVSLGDVNFSGEIEKYDYILVKRAAMKTVTLDAAQILAADVNENSEVEKYDYILIKRHCMKTYIIG